MKVTLASLAKIFRAAVEALGMSEATRIVVATLVLSAIGAALLLLNTALAA